MPATSNDFNQLKQKLDALLAKQDILSDELNEIKNQLLMRMLEENNIPSSDPKPIDDVVAPSMMPISQIVASDDAEVINMFEEVKKSDTKNKNNFPSFNEPSVFSEKKKKASHWTDELHSNFEKFVGENLLNKVGILITIIGVAIGTKYAIDHQLISPVTRIILAYLVGLGLMGVAIKLKSNYEKFSAVLLSGSMAINYVVTFAAYSLYALVPQPVAFILMILFTVFTVIAALKYNNVIIAQIGLVGAYALPFLLSTGSGRVELLLAYVALINSGILFIAFKKFWRSLFFVAYLFTWAIIWFWVLDTFTNDYFTLAMLFNLVFFVQFYTIFIAFKVVKNHAFQKTDVIVLLSNTFVSYGLGYYLMSYLNYETYLGLFTVGYALIHFAVCVFLFKKAEVDKNVFYLVAGLVLAFLSIAIPVQFKGHYVTLLWMFESVIVFVIARKNKMAFYEQIAVPLFLLSFFSFFEDADYSVTYNLTADIDLFHPFLNLNFISELIITCAFCFLTWFSRRADFPSLLNKKSVYSVLVKYGLPIISIIFTYGLIKGEVDAWYHNEYMSTGVLSPAEIGSIPVKYYNINWNYYRLLFDIMYSLAYALLLYFVNKAKIKSPELNIVFLLIAAVSLVFFFTGGLFQLSVLRDNYLHPTSIYHHSDNINLWLRYPLILLVLITLKYFLLALEQSNYKLKVTENTELIYVISFIWLLSSEWLNWSDIFDIAWSYKLGLSILWGLCSLSMIIRGIFKQKKSLRLMAILLFAVTLLKLFFYDIDSLSTILKTVVFISLGVLLLIISFLYNKHGLTIFNDEESNEK